MAGATAGCVWIIGASSGIGRALALRLAATGRTVVASARSVDDLTELGNEADALDGRIIAKPLDVSDRNACTERLSEIETEIAPVALFVFCAAFWKLQGKSDATDPEIFKQTFDVNILGAMNVLDPVWKAMAERGSGHIAMISSVAGYRGLPGAAAYGSSKAALTHICESIKPLCDVNGIKLQVIHPGFVETPMTARNPFPMPFIVSAEQAAARIVDGLDGSGFEITFPRRFTWQLKLLRILPYRLYFAITRRMFRSK